MADAAEFTPFEGGCVCGAVRYQVSAPPRMGAQCFCSDCQKVCCGSYWCGLIVPPEAFLYTAGANKLRLHTRMGDSGDPFHREFCPDCGCTIGFFAAPTEDRSGATFRVLSVGSLDDTSIYQPAAAIYTGRCKSWHSITEGLPTFEGPPFGVEGGPPCPRTPSKPST